MPELLTILQSSIPVASVNAVAEGILGFQDAALKRFPLTKLGSIDRLYINVGRDLTLADMRTGIITSTSAGNIVLVLPTFAALGWTRNAATPRELIFLFERDGLGPLFVNPSAGVTITWNDLNPTYLPKNSLVSLRTIGDNLWVAG